MCVREIVCERDSESKRDLQRKRKEKGQKEPEIKRGNTEFRI